MLPLVARFAALDCQAEKSQKLLGFIPKWYSRLSYEINSVTGHCEIHLSTNGKFDPNQLWLIALTAIDILLRIGGLVAVGFVIYGGFRYITSQGEPENTKAALSTIINALIGVGITVVAAAIVSFIASRLGG